MNISLIQKMINEVNECITQPIRIMEVCGTHTQAVLQHGITTLLDSNIKLLSGPGCPVCVTDSRDIDGIIELGTTYNVMIITFGDMVRVQGSKESLSDLREKGKKVQILYNPLDIIKVAENNKEKNVVFFGVGFETTAPLIAATIKIAKDRNLENLFFYLSLKRMKPILQLILKDPMNRPHGMICPGHVATITGGEYFHFIVDEYQVPAVICGFEPEDIITSIYCITMQNQKKNKLQFENLYKRCVKDIGNLKAKALLKDVFITQDAYWRGIGRIADSGFALSTEYERFDAAKVFSINTNNKTKESFCLCTEIILGEKMPADCPYFKKKCHPGSPMGPCMVSTEGTCFIYFSYGGGF